MVAGWIFCDLVVFRASGAQQQQKRAEAREREKSVRAAPLFISLSRCPTHLHPPARPLSAASHTRHSYSYCCFVAHTHTHRTLSLVLEPVFAGLLNVTALPLPLPLSDHGQDLTQGSRVPRGVPLAPTASNAAGRARHLARSTGAVAVLRSSSDASAQARRRTRDRHRDVHLAAGEPRSRPRARASEIAAAPRSTQLMLAYTRAHAREQATQTAGRCLVLDAPHTQA